MLGQETQRGMFLYLMNTLQILHAHEPANATSEQQTQDIKNSRPISRLTVLGSRARDQTDCGSTLRGSSTSSLMWSVGCGVVVINVTPSGD
jgi:hypothetical protein